MVHSLYYTHLNDIDRSDPYSLVVAVDKIQLNAPDGVVLVRIAISVRLPE